MATSSQGSNSPATQDPPIFLTDPAEVEEASQPFAILRADHGMRCLAQRMRPRDLDQILGQEHLLGPRGSFRAFLHSPTPSSFWLTGPPSSGKTSFAISASRFLDLTFLGLLFPGSDSQLLRQVLTQAQAQRSPKPCLLFTNNLFEFPIQEQEIVVPYITSGDIILCGSSSLDPHGSVSPLILSKCSFFQLRKLEPPHVKEIVKRAIDDKAHGLVQSLSVHPHLHVQLVVDDDAVDFLSSHVDGDARHALNILEWAAFKIVISNCVPNGTGMQTSLAELLQTLKNLHGARELEYIQPFKQFQNGLRMATPMPAPNEFEQPLVVHVTLLCIQDAFSPKP